MWFSLWAFHYYFFCVIFFMSPCVGLRQLVSTFQIASIFSWILHAVISFTFHMLLENNTPNPWYSIHICDSTEHTLWLAGHGWDSLLKHKCETRAYLQQEITALVLALERCILLLVSSVSVGIAWLHAWVQWPGLVHFVTGLSRTYICVWLLLTMSRESSGDLGAHSCLYFNKPGSSLSGNIKTWYLFEDCSIVFCS